MPSKPSLTPFTLLFDDSDGSRPSLPTEVQQVYGGDWRMPAPPPNRPLVYMNFATSRDGRVSFNLPGQMSGGDISDFNAHDQWLMGLLRARADAVMMGDTTMRVVPDHIWTAEYIYPPSADLFANLRRAEGLPRVPLHVFISQTGDLPAAAAVFARSDIAIVVATTTRGASRVRAMQTAARLDIVELGDEWVDLTALLRLLRHTYGIRNLLCEGGPRIYGALLKAGLVDEEFVTLCPIMVGDASGGVPRPSLIEDAAFTPATAPRLRLLSLRRAGDHLFLRSQYRL
jgi:riboflavin biosynthesis pyrimidine reductase